MPIDQFTSDILSLRREVAALKDAQLKAASVISTIEYPMALDIKMNWDMGLVWSETWEIKITTPEGEFPPLVAAYFDEFDQRYFEARRVWAVDQDDPDNNRLSFHVDIRNSLNQADWTGSGQRTIHLPMTIVSSKPIEFEIRRV